MYSKTQKLKIIALNFCYNHLERLLIFTVSDNEDRPHGLIFITTLTAKSLLTDVASFAACCSTEMEKEMASKPRGFTAAARQAAIAKRRERSDIKRDTFGHPEVFVVRHGDQGFRWEIRQFGAVVIARGEEIFLSMGLARKAGEAILMRSSDTELFDMTSV